MGGIDSSPEVASSKSMTEKSEAVDGESISESWFEFVPSIAKLAIKSYSQPLLLISPIDCTCSFAQHH